MINTVAFSPDLSHLFVVEESQVVSFPLTHPRGLIISKVQNQITAATAPTKLILKNAKVIDLNPTKYSWQINYSNIYKSLFIIGVGDIDFNAQIEATQAKYKTVFTQYDLEKNDLYLRRVENSLTVAPLRKQAAGVSDGTGTVA
jgi:hypothetical protein